MTEQLPTTVGFELEFSEPASEARGDINSIEEVAPSVTEALRAPSARFQLLDRIQGQLEAAGYGVFNLHNYRATPPSETHWDLKIDSSCGFEAASPVIKRYSDLLKHATVASHIQQAGGVVTDKCGLHVHVGVQDLTAGQLESLLRLCLRYELAFYMLMPEHRRRGTYCKGTSDGLLNKVKSCFRSSVSADINHRLAHAWNDKHTWLNCKPLSRQKTIEFRLMCGSLDPLFITRYVLFILHVVDAAINGRPGRWGRANARDAQLLFRSFLGAAGFYRPVSSNHDSDRAVVARKWALGWMRQQYSETAVPQAYRTQIERCDDWHTLEMPTSTNAETTARTYRVVGTVTGRVTSSSNLSSGGHVWSTTMTTPAWEQGANYGEGLVITNSTLATDITYPSS